jgi:hypothetical protein
MLLFPNETEEFPLVNSRLDHNNLGPSAGHDFNKPVSEETPVLLSGLNSLIFCA